MFAALKNAKDHIILESYIIEDDETSRKFADLLLQKQGEGIQVNFIYDSMGSMNTLDVFCYGYGTATKKHLSQKRK